MAKIVQVLTRPSKEYDLFTAEAQVRDLDAIVEKLNTTFQEELKEEVEAFNSSWNVVFNFSTIASRSLTCASAVDRSYSSLGLVNTCTIFAIIYVRPVVYLI